jgi:hypothetical protein
MQLTGKITRDSLMTLEAYSKYRKEHKADIIAHRKLRSVGLGEHITLQFESETSIRYQIQEMLRIEKIFEEEGIEQEIEAYAPLVPDGSNWKATMLIEYPDENERRRELARLIGVEDRMFVEVEGHARVYAIADEDLDRENDEKTSAVHFVRFELTPPMCAAVKAGASVKLGCDHTQLPGAHDHPAGDAGLAGRRYPLARRRRRWPARAGSAPPPRWHAGFRLVEGDHLGPVQVDAGRAQAGQAGRVVGHAGRVGPEQLRSAPTVAQLRHDAGTPARAEQNSTRSVMMPSVPRSISRWAAHSSLTV